MSMRSIVEFNHDYIERLADRGHISREFMHWLCQGESSRQQTYFKHNGARYLKMRHHSEKVTVEVE